ncbi:ABC transporter permease [Granulicatella elegans]|uniref:ABC transporter permease n=1 Tax=Granulicatella elegans TaxID=137732 RepID=UPI001D13F288|nr:ABC transporter permease [Granulicatella elegans]UEA30920.1 ABC transporter permease [Granulicatella elegans]
MTVYKYFLKLANRYKMYAIVYLIIFIGMALLQVSGKNETSKFEDTSIKMIIKDESNGTDEIMKHLVQTLQKNHNVQFTTNSDTSVKEMIYAGDVDAVLWIPSDVHSKLEKEQEVVAMEISHSLSGHLIREYVNAYIRYAVALKKQGDFSAEKIDTIMSQEAKVTLLSKEVVSSQYSKEKFGEHYFAYSPFIYFSVFIYLFGTIFSKMKGKEVAKRIAIAMKDERRVMLEQFLAGLTIVGLIVGINLLFVEILSPEFYTSSQALKILLLSTVSAISAYALSFLCAVVIGENQYAYSAASTIFGMGLAFLSGIFVPLDLVSSFGVNIAKFFPVYYVTSAANNSSTEFSSYAFHLGMIVLFTILYVVMAFSVQRIRRNKKFI